MPGRPRRPTPARAWPCTDSGLIAPLTRNFAAPRPRRRRRRRAPAFATRRGRAGPTTATSPETWSRRPRSARPKTPATRGFTSATMRRARPVGHGDFRPGPAGGSTAGDGVLRPRPLAAQQLRPRREPATRARSIPSATPGWLTWLRDGGNDIRAVVVLRPGRLYPVYRPCSDRGHPPGRRAQ